jgi:hypothetical protein
MICQVQSHILHVYSISRANTFIQFYFRHAVGPIIELDKKYKIKSIPQ